MPSLYHGESLNNCEIVREKPRRDDLSAGFNIFDAGPDTNFFNCVAIRGKTVSSFVLAAKSRFTRRTPDLNSSPRGVSGEFTPRLADHAGPFQSAPRVFCAPFSCACSKN